MNLLEMNKREICLACSMAECDDSSPRCGLRRKKGLHDAAYYARNAEKRRSQGRSNYVRTADSVKKRVRDWKRKNRDLVAEQQRRYRAKKRQE